MLSQSSSIDYMMGTISRATWQALNADSCSFKFKYLNEVYRKNHLVYLCGIAKAKELEIKQFFSSRKVFNNFGY